MDSDRHETSEATRSASRPLTRRNALAAATLVLGEASGRSTGSRSRIEAVLDLAMRQSSTSILVSVEGVTKGERYAPSWTRRPREVASVAKSMIALLIAMAIEDGVIGSLDQPAADFIPQWRSDPRAAITLRHLMSMTSGLDDTGLALRNVAGDQFALNAAAPLRHPPGARWAYNTAAYHLLFHILERAVGRPFADYGRDRLLAPLGMADTIWITSIGEGEAGRVTNYYSAASTARNLARLGALVIGRGACNGRRLLAEDSLQELLRPSQALNPSYGLLWWENALPGLDASGRALGLRFPSAPADTVAALGAGGQAVLIVPSRDLVIVRQGDTPAEMMLPDALLRLALSP